MTKELEDLKCGDILIRCRGAGTAFERYLMVIGRIELSPPLFFLTSEQLTKKDIIEKLTNKSILSYPPRSLYDLRIMDIEYLESYPAPRYHHELLALKEGDYIYWWGKGECFYRKILAVDGERFLCSNALFGQFIEECQQFKITAKWFTIEELEKHKSAPCHINRGE